jgi:hypothetical protein
MTKSFDDYLNDPRIKNEPMGLRITHAMRFKVQDETKGMTPSERTAYYNGSATGFLASDKSRPSGEPPLTVAK